MFWLYVHLPSNSYIALGILWLAKNPKADPLFLQSNRLTLQEPSLVLAEVLTDVRL